MTELDDLSREDLLKIMARDRAVKAELSSRIGALVCENIEFLGVIREYENDVHTLREQLAAQLSE